MSLHLIFEFSTLSYRSLQYCPSGELPLFFPSRSLAIAPFRPFDPCCKRTASIDGYTTSLQRQPSPPQLLIGYESASMPGDITPLCDVPPRRPSKILVLEKEQSPARSSMNVPAEFQYPRGFLNQIPSNRALRWHSTSVYETESHGKQWRRRPAGCTNQGEG